MIPITKLNICSIILNIRARWTFLKWESCIKILSDTKYDIINQNSFVKYIDIYLMLDQFTKIQNFVRLVILHV